MKKTTYSNLLIGSILLFLTACATSNPQQIKGLDFTKKNNDVEHTFYITGGQENEEPSLVLTEKLQTALATASKNSTLLFTGDFLAKNTDKKQKKNLKSLLSLTHDFKGKTYLNLGENEWASKKTKDIEWIENFIKDKDLKKVSVQPNNVCPLDYTEINDELAILFIDSNWYISNWDRIEDINRKCIDIVTRRRFAEALEGYIKDARNKNLVIVMHHPVFNNGKYNSMIGGFSPSYGNFKRYNELRVLVAALSQEVDRVTIVSGHDPSLQYLKGANVHQIISGAMGTSAPVNRKEDNITTIGGLLKYEGQYAHGANGFSVLKYYKDGSATVSFITEHDEKTMNVTPALNIPNEEQFDVPNISEANKTIAVTTDKEKLNKSGVYNFIWGKRYREYFGRPVSAPVAILNQRETPLTITKKGGGHQSFSARLADAQGKEYAMRGLEKNALKFLRFKIKGLAFNEENYKDTFAEEAVYDFFSTTHPYMQLVINPLAAASKINHANTQLYYLPKQPGFELLGSKYGNQLYYIEERPNDEHKNFEGYNRANPDVKGKIVQFESTTDVFEKIKEDEKYSLDQRAFIRARLFDMLIGDWDRHNDQWRWAQYRVNDDDIRFIPVPRDRDAAFSKFDGIAIPLIRLALPDVRFWQSYDAEIPNIKWFNGEGNNLDRALLNKFDYSVWMEEAKNIQEGITNEVIEKAFKKLPKEVQDEKAEAIKEKLKGRLQNLVDIAEVYGKRMDAIVSVHGTNKDDIFTITRLANGKTKVTIARDLKNKKNKVFYNRTFNTKETKEIWLYGLEDDDLFIVNGDNSDHEIKVRLIGGYGKDKFDISNKKKLKVYDWRHEKTKFEDKKPANQLTNRYETNTWHWRYFKENNNILLPAIGFRRDDGLFLGATDTYTNNEFNGNPFRYQHALSVNYFFETSALELDYDGVFANVFPNWNLEVGVYATNSGYAKNYFGAGNETTHDEDDVDLEFNRARTEQIIGDIGFASKYFKAKGIFETWEIEEDADRLFNSTNFGSTGLLDRQYYVGGEATVFYENKDAADFPTKELMLSATLGYKSNIDLEDNNFGYASAKIGIKQKLIASGNLVFSTLIEGKTNFGNDYFFYHAPSIGGDNGLRGFRDERFTGDSYLYQTSDLNIRLGKIVTSVIPINYGIYGGFDYGRVWLENENSDLWHTSQGGGIWLSGLNSFGLNAGYFTSKEGAQVQIGFGFGF
ncbi:outer membrane protein [unidentified eubacterium SCB49]|nr:outer membrane protein [unidentified eubacterium SCB49]